MEFDNLGHFDIFRTKLLKFQNFSSTLVNFGQYVQQINDILKTNLHKCERCLTKFSWLFEFGAALLPLASLHCCGLMVSSPGPCASSGGRLPEALFMVFLLDSKGAEVYPEVQECVHLLDLVKSFQTSIYYSLGKFGFDTAENEPLKVCQQFFKC